MAMRFSRLTPRSAWIGAAAMIALTILGTPVMAGFVRHAHHRYESGRPAYKARYGSWDAVRPSYRVNPLHAILLHTGRVLLIDGSGEGATTLDGGRSQSTVWDPATGAFRKIDAPEGLSGGGHTQLADGTVLIAGGTAGRDMPAGDAKRAGGFMTVRNEDPHQARNVPRGTLFRSPSGVRYRSRTAVRVGAARTVADDTTGRVSVVAAESRVLVEAVRAGAGGVTNASSKYALPGLESQGGNTLYGIAGKLGLDKAAFRGSKAAYVFDPVTEKYTRVASMNEARWHPTLTLLPDGRVLAASGLDADGQTVPGASEVYAPDTGTWSKTLAHAFPTYPSLFAAGGRKVFYSGANAGYGPTPRRGSEVGLWNLKNSDFTPVGPPKDPDALENASAVLLPPAQDHRVMLLGGGGVGESHATTSRTAIVDLDDPHPAFRQGPPLPQNTRYLNSVVMPDDTVFTTGGSTDYRGRGASDIRTAQFYLPAADIFVPAAEPTVGRNHHSEALLLPDGRVAVFGSDPLFSDKANSRPGHFEQRIEVYSPPYLFHGRRPHLKLKGSSDINRGDEITFGLPDAAGIGRVRLMRPGSVTQGTDFDQRSVALDITRRTSGSLTVHVPDDPALVPHGWYMAFATNVDGTPSTAVWLHVRPSA
ncbi:galactose oxidase-like domain-containing protein [Streptomyces sp. SAS_275]|uniref:galactose oxidase-like domain-containing protein n=1 Tax=Streptomyces sp. SAS_275 TaxID=3412746 RepID=UPI00403C2426